MKIEKWIWLCWTLILCDGLFKSLYSERKYSFNQESYENLKMYLKSCCLRNWNIDNLALGRWPLNWFWHCTNQLNFACGGHGGIIGPISVWWLKIFGGPLVDSILSHSVGFLYNKSDWASPFVEVLNNCYLF